MQEKQYDTNKIPLTYHTLHTSGEVINGRLAATTEGGLAP